jgi:ubiquinone/menaquinone biosynthesis C-methylase UbiE
MTQTQDRYVPALGYRWLTPAYDRVVALTTRESTFKAALVQQLAPRSGERILDVACGTATLTLLAARAAPGVNLTGLDGDPQMLERARAKARAASVDIGFDVGMSDRMPYADGAFDKVMSSLFFHHLQCDAKSRTFAEIFRVLKSGGELHVADWGRAANQLMRAAFFGIQLLDGFTNTGDNVAGLLPQLMRDAGFTGVEETRRFSTVFGTMSLYRAARP